MIRRMLLALALGGAAAGFATGALAQVKATLVAHDRSVEPGHPFLVALRLEQQPGWHTYWLNPGTGLATTLTWSLPPGWSAGPIQWPAPQVLVDSSGTVTGNGYEGEVLLPVTLTPPANLAVGTQVTVSARADWLMCRDMCIPGRAVVALSLPVGKGPPAPDQNWAGPIDAVLSRLPRPDPAWTLSSSRTDKTVTLRIAATPGDPRNPPRGLHFFADDDFVAYDGPQAVAPDGKGGYVMTLPIAPDGPTHSKRLVGVLTSSDGWSANGDLPALRVDLAFTRPAAAPAGVEGAAGSGPVAPAAGGGGSLLATLGLAFVGGLILNLMPCVFPVLGIKILGFVNQAGADRRKVVAHGLMFSAGVLVSFWLLAGVLEILRGGGDRLGWGFQLQSPGFIFALAAVMLIFALNLSGLFEFGLSATAIGSSWQGRAGYSGSFFTGVLATLVATPCSAPFLAPALGAALALSFGAAFAVFTAIALGLSAPYLLLSLVPSAVKALPRPGAWMETFRQLMAFPLYATVAYLIWILAGQVQETALLNALFGLVAVALAAWIYGRWTAPGASSGRVRFGVIGGAIVLVAGAWNGWPVPPPPSAVVWQKWSPEAVSRLHDAGRIVYVDFTARWCATCQANKRIVFHSPEVLREFKDKHVATLRGDWTNQDPEVTAELAKYHRSAVPFNEVWLPNRSTPVVLPELLTPGIVLHAVDGS